MKRLVVAFGLVAAALLFGPGDRARAEVAELRLARQYGISHLAMALIDELQLVEKHAARAGLGDIKVSWRRFSDGPGMNEALLSGNLDVANGGLTALIVLYDKSKGAFTGLSALSSMPAVMMTRNPNVRSVKDLAEQDRIALVSRVSMQAIILRMFAEQAFGQGQASKLDHLTVTLPHPEAMAALISGRTEITAHFTAAPYYQQEEAAGLHRSINSYDILGGPATYSVAWASRKFMDENPKTTRAVLAALEEAIDLIKSDPRRAAETYVKAEDPRLDPAWVEKMIRDPENVFTMTPQNVMKFAEFMAKTGAIRQSPANWKELFPLLAERPGS
jgi:ABC-type nitrate/sulfonate/bicarbonate transport system substrate-binding protein